jgi:hypothetical protein
VRGVFYTRAIQSAVVKSECHDMQPFIPKGTPRVSKFKQFIFRLMRCTIYTISFLPRRKKCFQLQQLQVYWEYKSIFTDFYCEDRGLDKVKDIKHTLPNEERSNKCETKEEVEPKASSF